MNSAFVDRDKLESQIAGLLAKADRKAIDLIYENYAETLLGLVKRIVSDPQAAEEVLHDVFIKIWKNARTYKSKKGRLFTWFANIARNAAIDYTRSANYRKQQKTTSTETFVHSDVLGNTEAVIADSGLRTVLDSLDDKYRDLIELTYFQGYSQRQIEKEFGIPLGTVKTRLRAAISELRAKLNNDIVQKLLQPVVLINIFLNGLF